ncbi:MAG TPA: hypothetical protein PL101_10410 [Bacteroidales bacterium]|nr:hypothetical protein [Bacteroidales bacterium]HQK71511.1 hypothetical protein [Bacteroidales bacterium]
MKKKLVFWMFIMFVAWSFTSCENLFQKCKLCKTVTYENGTVISETDEVEYCGADLVKKEATPPITVGNLTTKVECR